MVISLFLGMFIVLFLVVFVPLVINLSARIRKLENAQSATAPGIGVGAAVTSSAPGY